MEKMLLEKFGINPNTDKPVREYIVQSEDAGEIKVKVFATNGPEVFVGKYTDPKGGIDWTIRPLEGEK